jgi:predicted NAD/FAD-binding protein
LTSAAIAELEDAHTGVGIRSVKTADSEGGRVTITTEAGAVATYDAVVLATHADVSLAMLGDSCPQVCHYAHCGSTQRNVELVPLRSEHRQ